MNIHDVPAIEVPVGACRLEMMFETQMELIEKYMEIEKMPPLPVSVHTAEGQKWLKDFAWRITEELGEAMNCLKNKPWKQTQMPTDEDHFWEEMADAVHFLIELFIIGGMSAEDFFQLYYRKSQVNKFRQRSKY